MAERIGYLEESCYADEGNVIRHGDALRDMLVDEDTEIRVLGLIGLSDNDVSQDGLLSGDEPVAYVAIWENGLLWLNMACYTDPNVRVYGLDTELLNVRQAIKVEMYGFTTLSILKLTEGGGR